MPRDSKQTDHMQPSHVYIIDALKQELKARKVRYQDLARHLQVSEGTIKRYLKGRGLTVEILDSLAEVVDLTLVSLVSRVDQRNIGRSEITKSQERELGRMSSIVGVVFFLLLQKWTPTRIAEEFDLNSLSISTALTQLEKIGVIRVAPSGRVVLLVNGSMEAVKGGSLGKNLIEQARAFVEQADMSRETVLWHYTIARLSTSSQILAKKLIRQFVSDLIKLSERDVELPSSEIQWFRLFTGLQPITAKQLLGEE
jgi:transcriptional regulator with XRE-family HTH domain